MELSPSQSAALDPPLEDTRPASDTESEGAHAVRHIDALVAAVLDLGCGYEHALRTILCVHRLLERVRCCGPASPEGTLLVQEVSRCLASLRDSAVAVEDRRAAASRCVAALAPVGAE